MFWEQHFAKVMSHDQFAKGYQYMFRHMYGKEGSRKNYTPQSCLKIIMGAPPEPGAFHGCPYRYDHCLCVIYLSTYQYTYSHRV
jgi:DNA primase large subunit